MIAAGGRRRCLPVERLGADHDLLVGLGGERARRTAALPRQRTGEPLAGEIDQGVSGGERRHDVGAQVAVSSGDGVSFNPPITIDQTTIASPYQTYGMLTTPNPKTRARS